MTVHYLSSVHTSSAGVFLKLLLRWRGGIHKLVIVELVIFLILFYAINVVYRFLLPKPQKLFFTEVVKLLFEYQSKIPMAVILGFFISAVYANFIRRFQMIPWNMKIISLLSFHLYGHGHRETMIRANIIRYLNTALIMTIVRVHRHKLFIDIASLVKRGVLTSREAEMINSIPYLHVHPFIPICWSLSLLVSARNEELLSNTHGFVFIVEAINDYKKCLFEIILSDQLTFPLIYTQVNTLAVYSYFLFSLIGSQLTVYNGIDIYFPIQTVIQFLVYMGLLKCAIGLLNPMGNDEENFEIDEVILYNWMIGHCISNDVADTAPERLHRDIFWNTDRIDLEETYSAHGKFK